MRRAFLDVQPNLHCQFARKRHHRKVADSQTDHFHVDRALACGDILGLMLFEQREVRLSSRQLFHRANVGDVLRQVLTIFSIELVQIVTAQLLVVQISVRVVRREVVRQLVLHC